MLLSTSEQLYSTLLVSAVHQNKRTYFDETALVNILCPDVR